MSLKHNHDSMSESMAASWRGGAVKALERQHAALVAAEPIESRARGAR